jgi:CO/xanthine dehydrogenase Mo-binding subunit
VEFALRNMSRKANDTNAYTDYTVEECIRRGAAAFDWKARWKPKPGSDTGPVKRGAGFSFLIFRSALGRSSAVIDVNSAGRYIVHVGVTDVGAGAKTTMGIIAAETLGVPLSQIDVVWGDTARCPYSVGESGSRTTIQTGWAVAEAARDIKKQIAEKGMPKGNDLFTATMNPNPTVAEGKVRASYGAHFCEVEVDTAVGHVRVTKYVAVHDSGRIMNTLSAAGQIKGAVTQGIGMALHEELLYDPRSGQALTAGYYGHRVLTHMDTPDVEVIFVESDDGYGPYGAKSIGEAGKIPAVPCIGNAIFNATGKRMRDLPIRRDRLVEVLS